MPKLKTNKSIKRRIRRTATGKLMANQAGRRHLLSGRRPKNKRQLRSPLVISIEETRMLRPLIPA